MEPATEPERALNAIFPADVILSSPPYDLEMIVLVTRHASAGLTTIQVVTNAQA